MKLRSLCTLFVMLGVCLTPFVLAANSAPAVVAIFVSNRAGPEYDAKLLALEDFVTTRVTNAGLNVISRETALNAARQLDPNAKENAVDQAFANSTSALRLAQNLQANYLLQVTISGVDTRKRKVDAYGVKMTNIDYNVRVSYKVLDGSTGASLLGDTVKTGKSLQETAVASDTFSDLMNELLDDASTQVAASVSRKIASLPPPQPARGQAEIEVIVKTAEVTLIVGPGKTAQSLAAAGFTAQVDGVAMGSVPGRLRVNKGLSRLRVSHADYVPWEQQINAVDGQVITVVMELSGAARSEKQDTAKTSTAVGLVDKHLSRIVIIGGLSALVLAAVIVFAIVLRSRRERARLAAEAPTVIAVNNNNNNNNN